MANRDTGKIREQIRQEYIQGIADDDGVRKYPSMRELSRNHGTTANTISRWAREGDWLNKRQEFQDQLTKKISEKKVNKLAEQASQFDKNCLTIANGMISEVGRRLQENLSAIRGDGNTVALEIYQIKDLSQIALNGQKLGKLALGEASEIHKGTIDVDGDEAFKRALQQLRAMREERAQSHTTVH